MPNFSLQSLKKSPLTVKNDKDSFPETFYLYHLDCWQEILERSLGYQARYFAVYNKSGKIELILPFFIPKSLLWVAKKYIAIAQDLFFADSFFNSKYLTADFFRSGERSLDGVSPTQRHRNELTN